MFLNTKKKVLLIGASEYNVVDGVIVRGIKNLLKDHEITYLKISDFDSMEKKHFLPDENFDLLVYAGTPFIWDQFQHSQKWKNTMKCKEIHKEAQMVYFGIGTCISLNSMGTDTEIMRREEDIKFLKKTYENSTVIVRDSLAKDLLTNAGIESTLLPCPSFFCYEEDEEPAKKGKNVLIYYDPETGVSEIYWKLHPTELKDYYRMIKQYISEYKPDIYCVMEHELENAEKYGIKNVKVLDSVDENLELMKNSRTILSGRVHCSVPAFVANKAVGLIPMDSRHLTLKDFGGTMVNSPKDFYKMIPEKRDFSEYRKQYEEILGLN